MGTTQKGVLLLPVLEPIHSFIRFVVTGLRCSMKCQAEAVENGTVTCVMCVNKRIRGSLQADLSLVIKAANAVHSKVTAMRFQARSSMRTLRPVPVSKSRVP